MSEIKALGKLRTAARNMAKGRNLENHEECNLLLLIADEIEREIVEHYMELPVDADGVPIHVGDEMELDNERFVVCAVALGRVHRWYVHNIGELDRGTVAYPPNSLHHYKPRTLEDVLREYALEMNLTYETGEIGGEERAEALDDLTAKYADEIRELMEVGE